MNEICDNAVYEELIRTAFAVNQTHALRTHALLTGGAKYVTLPGIR